MSSVFVRKKYLPLAGWLAVGVSMLLVGIPWKAAAEAAHRPRRTADLQRVVNRLRTRLAIPVDVLVELVDRNPRMASVQRVSGRQDVFLLSIDREFLVTLSEAEVDALMAHELGHVWIHTNHPYLQTEQLANRVAMRLVPAEQLRQVYGKVWAAADMTGDLEAFLGLPPSPGQERRGESENTASTAPRAEAGAMTKR